MKPKTKAYLMFQLISFIPLLCAIYLIGFKLCMGALLVVISWGISTQSPKDFNKSMGYE